MRKRERAVNAISAAPKDRSEVHMKTDAEWYPTRATSLVWPSILAAIMPTAGTLFIPNLARPFSLIRLHSSAAKPSATAKPVESPRIPRTRLRVKSRRLVRRKRRGASPARPAGPKADSSWLWRLLHPNRLTRLLILGISFVVPKRASTLTKIERIASHGSPVLETWHEVLTGQDLTFALQEASC